MKLSDETKKLFKLACGLVINAGNVGGWIEKESNLSDNDCVSDDDWVFDNARIYGNAEIYSDDARVASKAEISVDAV